MAHLKNVSTTNLVQELLTRPLLKENGLVEPTLWNLRKALGIIPCVDSLAVRQRKGKEKEAFAIIRNTGPYAGKWCAVGGTIGRGESIEEALVRNWASDLEGSKIKLIDDWNQPFTMHQHMPPVDGLVRKDFCPEPTKYSMAPFYRVKLLKMPTGYGSTAHGGQEAAGMEWFSLATLPPKEAFAYGFHEVFVRALESEW